MLELENMEAQKCHLSPEYSLQFSRWRDEKGHAR